MQSTMQYLALIAILAAAGVIFYPQVERALVFFPEKRLEQEPAQLGLNYEEVRLATPAGVVLHGWYFAPPQNGLVLLFCHGNAGNVSHRLDNVQRLVEFGLGVFIFDYRGYGLSTGRPSEKGIYDDGLAAYDWLVKEKGLPDERVLLFGRSLGAAVAIEIALKRPARALVIESAFTSTREMARTLPFFSLLAPVVPAHFNNLAKVPRVNLPKLHIHGERDEIVPFEMGERLYAAAAPPKRFHALRAAGHNDTYLVGGRAYFEMLVHFARNPGG